MLIRLIDRVYVPPTKVVVVDPPYALFVFNQSIRHCAGLFVEVHLQKAVPLQQDAAPDDNGLGLQIDGLHKGPIRQRVQQGRKKGFYVHSAWTFW